MEGNLEDRRSFRRRLRRANDRVVILYAAGGGVQGYLVKSAVRGQLPLGPFRGAEEALQAALEDTEPMTARERGL